MEKIKITKIYTTDKDKLGNPLKSKKGFPYTRMSIKCEQFGDQWLSGFQNADNKEWKEGDEVEIIKTENSKDGKIYLNFETPKKDNKVIEMLSELLIKVGKLNANVEYLKDRLVSPSSVDNTAIDPETGMDLNYNPPF